MHLLIDNYDSFTYNVVQSLEVLGETTLVRRNDAIDLAEIEALDPEAIILSPGPCTPQEAGICVDAVKTFAGRKPILGICLGHQCIAAAFGGRVAKADIPRHGKASSIRHSGAGIFEGVPQDTVVGRYHSLVVETMPDGFETTAITAATATATGAAGTSGVAGSADPRVHNVPRSEVIMAIEHRLRPVVGVQFHPESIITVDGMTMLANFARTARSARMAA